MDINTFLNPIDEKLINEVRLESPKQFGNSITIYKDENNFPDLLDCQLAIVGIEEERNCVDNEGCKFAPNEIRKAFYRLFNHWENIKIVDLGNIKPGFQCEDAYFAVSQVFLALMRHHIVPIFLGGSQDLTFPIYQVYENTGKLVNITAIDSKFDIGTDNERLDSHSYLSYIIMHKPNYLFNYTNIGYQSYYVDLDNIELMKQLLFDIYRLGSVKNKLELTEPLLRNADIVSIDLSAFKASEIPGMKNGSPNGFTGEEGCRMARYAGLNSKLTSIGFFEYNPGYDVNRQGANNIAEMIWYFVEGFANRVNDFPTNENKDDFVKYIVQIEGQREDLVFLCHKMTKRWWIDLSLAADEKRERHHYIPCSHEDYELSMENEIPDKWWQFYQKLM